MFCQNLIGLSKKKIIVEKIEDDKNNIVHIKINIILKAEKKIYIKHEQKLLI